MSRPWMPLYVSDYLADTGHLSTLEHGAYLLLIMHYWQQGGLPRSDEKLARISRMPVQEWKKIRKNIASLFNARWRHKRIDKELAKALVLYEKRSEAGKLGAAARGRTILANEQAELKPSLSKTEAGLVQPQPQPHSVDSTDTLVDEAAREMRGAAREGKNRTSVCRVAYSQAERKALAFEFDGLDVDAAIAELDRWCDRKLINDPIDRKSAIYGALRKRHGRAKLADSMNSEAATASPELTASKLTRKRVNGKTRHTEP
jgi:uncharacterized protein YdaU (DUF1376 family)